MKSRIVIFFAIIEIVLFSYFAFPFNSSSSEENRALKTNIVIEDDIVDAVLSGDFQNQLEELMSDQIIFRNNQVVYKGKLEKLLGFRKRFSGNYYKYNDQTILDINKYTAIDNLTENYTIEFYNQVESITRQLQALGIDFSIYYSNLENYYCYMDFEECSILGSSRTNQNFYFSNDILQNDEFAFIAGDHHLSSESQYKIFSYIMEDLGYGAIVKSFDNYYDTTERKQSIGSKERSSNGIFDIKGVTYKPIYPDNATLTAYSKTVNLADLENWNLNSRNALNGTISAGYCGLPEGVVSKSNEEFYVQNPNAQIDESILIIGNSQICGLTPFMYQTFTQTHTFDFRNQKIDVIEYVNEKNIDHVIYYGTDPFSQLDTWFIEL